MRLSRGLLTTLLMVTPLHSAPQNIERIAPAAASGPVAMGWEVLDKGLTDSSERHRQQVVLAAGNIGRGQIPGQCIPGQKRIGAADGRGRLRRTQGAGVDPVSSKSAG